MYISGNLQIKKFLDWIYNDSNSSNRLSRKYDKYMHFTLEYQKRQNNGRA